AKSRPMSVMFIVDTFCGYLSLNPNMAHRDAGYTRGVHLIIHGILWSATAIPTATSGSIGVACITAVSTERAEEGKGWVYGVPEKQCALADSSARSVKPF
ncbi:hypothetical protein Q9290_16220, partial [Oceanimonas sp. CHS3-5]|uniref:hypothetical protein n=1 Tax=Oceanimonas sp. CHS3-5 TaxID=3068186 RepID=UPI00273F87F3